MANLFVGVVCYYDIGLSVTQRDIYLQVGEIAARQ